MHVYTLYIHIVVWSKVVYHILWSKLVSYTWPYMVQSATTKCVMFIYYSCSAGDNRKSLEPSKTICYLPVGLGDTKCVLSHWKMLTSTCCGVVLKCWQKYDTRQDYLDLRHTHYVTLMQTSLIRVYYKIAIHYETSEKEKITVSLVNATSWNSLYRNF